MSISDRLLRRRPAGVLLLGLCVYSLFLGWRFVNLKVPQVQSSSAGRGILRRVSRQSNRLILWTAKENISLPLYQAGEAAQDLLPGDEIAYQGMSSVVSPGKTPGYALYLKAKGMERVVRASAVRKVKPGKGLTALAARARYALARFTDEKFRSDAPYLKGLLYGDTDEIPPQIKQAFAASGTSHLLAVSGSHIALVTGGLSFLLRRRSFWAKTFFCLTLMWFYIAMVGGGPSPVRAGVFYMLYVYCTLFQRRFDVVNAACVTGAVMLLQNPYALFDMGFALSFAAVISIGWFYPPLDRVCGKVKNAFARPLLRLMALTLSAQILTWPIVYWAFGQVSLCFLPTNLLCAGVLAILYPLYMISIAASLCPPVEALLVQAVRFLVEIFVNINQVAAKLPGAVWVTPRPDALVALLTLSATALLYHSYASYQCEEYLNESNGYDQRVEES